MLALGVFGGKYMTDCRDEFPASWFAGAKLSPGRRDPALNYFGVDASQPLSVWRKKGMDPPRRPARLVSMVLPLVSRPPHARRRPAPDRTLESDPPSRSPDQATLRTGRPVLPQTPAPG